MITLKSWLEDFLKDNRSRLDQIKTITVWDEVVGPRLASITQAKKIRQTTLIVEVKEQEWQIELTYHVGNILEKYQKIFPNFKIKKIYFKYNPHLEKKENRWSNKIDGQDVKREDQNRKNGNQSSDPANSGVESEARSVNIDQRLERSLSRLKVVWSELKQKKKVLSLTPTEPPPKSTKPKSKQFLEVSEIYDRHKVYSKFLNSRDEFQPFDLF